jgi:hypothetical protein
MLDKAPCDGRQLCDFTFINIAAGQISSRLSGGVKLARSAVMMSD